MEFAFQKHTVRNLKIKPLPCRRKWRNTARFGRSSYPSAVLENANLSMKDIDCLVTKGLVPNLSPCQPLDLMSSKRTPYSAMDTGCDFCTSFILPYQHFVMWWIKCREYHHVWLYLSSGSCSLGPQSKSKESYELLAMGLAAFIFLPRQIKSVEEYIKSSTHWSRRSSHAQILKFVEVWLSLSTKEYSEETKTN